MEIYPNITWSLNSLPTGPRHLKGRQACWFLGSAVVLESKETLLSNPKQPTQPSSCQQHRPNFCRTFLHQQHHGRHVFVHGKPSDDLIEAKLLFHAPLPEIRKELSDLFYPILDLKPYSFTTPQKLMWSTSCTLPVQTTVITQNVFQKLLAVQIQKTGPLAKC